MVSFLIKEAGTDIEINNGGGRYLRGGLELVVWMRKSFNHFFII